MYSKLPHGVAVSVSDHPGVGEGKPATPGKRWAGGEPDIKNNNNKKINITFWALKTFMYQKQVKICPELKKYEPKTIHGFLC